MPYQYTLKQRSGDVERIVADSHRSAGDGSWISLQKDGEVIAVFNGLTGWRRVEQE